MQQQPALLGGTAWRLHSWADRELWRELGLARPAWEQVQCMKACAAPPLAGPGATLLSTRGSAHGSEAANQWTGAG